jgi:hypothetical protein
MFRYDWSQFNTRIGLIFMVGLLVTFQLMGRVDFSMYAAGISALLAWLPIVLAPQVSWLRHVLGLLAYLLLGALLIIAAAALVDSQTLRYISMALVTFLGYLMLLRGMHPYLVAWCLVYWYMLVPLFLAAETSVPVMLGHLVGAGLVLALILVKPLWLMATSNGGAEEVVDEKTREEEVIPTGYAVRYAAVVALSITVGVIAGARWLVSDPTLVANATLNMISPSLQQTWQSGFERLLLGGLGIVAGFYFGWAFPDPWVGRVVMALGGFFALGMLYINMQLLVGMLFFIVAYSWGAMRSEAGHELANEKLIAEFVGVAIAIGALTLLVWMSERKGNR